MFSDIRKRSGQFLLLCAGIVVAGEVCLGLFNFPDVVNRSFPVYVPHSRYHHFHKPHGLYIQRTRENGAVRERFMRFDAEGLRDRSPKPGLPQVLFIGDSMVEGMGVGLNELFASRVEDLLGNVDVKNVSCSSWSPLNYYMWISENIAQLAGYKAVYLFYFPNDPYNTISYLEDADDPSDPDGVTFAHYVRSSAAKEGNLYQRWLREHSRIYSLLFYIKVEFRRQRELRAKPTMPVRVLVPPQDIHNSQGFESLFVGVRSERQRKAVALDSYYIGKIQGLLAKHDLKLSLVYVPLAQQVGFDENAGIFPPYTEESRQIIYESNVFQDHLSRLAAQSGFTFIDLKPALREYKSHNSILLYNERDLHFSTAGHAAVAQILAPVIMADLYGRDR